MDTERNYRTNASMKNLEMENVLLIKVLDQIETYEQLGEQLLSFAENLIIIKDIVQSFAKKIIEIEETKSKKLLFIDTELDDLSELCSDIKSDVIKLYDNVVSSNLTQENEVYYGESRQNNPCYSYMISVKEELELVKKECSQMTSDSKKIEKSAAKGKYVIESLKREINKIKEGSLEKDLVIYDLKRSVRKGQIKMKEQEKENNFCLSKINTIGAEKAYLENEVKTFSDVISSPNNILTKFNTDFPIDTSNFSNFMGCVSQELKQCVQNKGLVVELTESETFFTSQCSLLISYVKDLEIKLLSTQNDNVSLSEEVNSLKQNLKRTKNHIDEADKFLNRIISSIPFKISSIHEALEAAEYIFSEYKTLKEIDIMVCGEQKANQDKLAQQLKDIQFLEKYNSDLKIQLESYENDIRKLRSELRNLRSMVCDEQKANQDKLAQQLKDMKYLEKHNSDLKVQLESYENEIRKLRSELRNLRSEWQKKERLIVKSNEQKSQTGNLCYRESQDQILKLEELARARSLKITSLEHQMINEILPY